ncbi:Putative CDP-alcohol phosphatidyltransferase [Septoria linicola]|uniref:CDP-alcohol phosphatidyltransferase n=1 Tax=Septoria linicola TaxID=215465 RepID=A0A9Q9AMJ5_9PEZI|nr:putative CDP-alcohol phosphatidyltransferase [Septoria linicola]USW50859.1 Putative CDP-alcohol phosphatidyltransferase [Septoria linicola]
MLQDNKASSWLFPVADLRALSEREYHYNAYSNTLLDQYMQPFWRWLIEYVPTYVTASTISLCGLVCNVMATCITVYYAPTLTEPLPAWLSITNAVSIFLYQTFDGLDGKQCFRTQDSEMEEYADHAVDSISVTLNAVLLAAALQLGDSTFLLGTNFLLAMTAFFAAHWAAQRTNSLVFGSIDVTEAQWVMIAIHIANAVGGSTLWDTSIMPILSVSSREVLAISSTIPLFFAIYENSKLALDLQDTPLETHGIRIPRSRFSIRPLRTYAVIVFGSMLCFACGLLSVLTVPTLLIVGLSLGRAGTRLILQKFVRRPGLDLDAAAFAPLGLSVLHIFCGDDFGLFSQSAWLIALALTLEVFWFHTRAMLDLSTARNIDIFYIRRQSGEKRPQSNGFYVSNGEFTKVKRNWDNFAADHKRMKATYDRSSR